MLPRRLPLLLACSLALLGPVVARASGLRGELAVERDAAALVCPDAAGLSARVTALVGRPLIVPTGRGDLSMDVQISCSPAGCRARISTRGASRGLRDLDDPDPSCAGLADALALTIAMLLDWTPGPALSASASASASASSPPAVSSPPVAASVFPSGVPASSGAPPPVSRLVGVAAGGGVATGVLPAAAGLWSAEIEAQGASWWRVSLGLSGAPAQSLAYQGGSVTMRYLAGSVVGCLPVRAGGVEVGACGALLLARFEAEGSDFPQNDSTRRLWWLPGLGVDARGPLVGPLGWSLRALLAVRDRDQTVSVGSLGTAAHLARVGLQTRAALTLSIW
jgi:hypothetical protein